VRLQVKGKNVEVSPALREYAEKKLERVERHLHNSARIELALIVEQNPAMGATQVAEGTVWTNGQVLRARESTEDMRASIDLMAEKLGRQAQKVREKTRWSSNRRTNHEEEPVHELDEGEPLIVKTKRFAMKPMSPEEAILQLERLAHDFFVFLNAETGDVNVLYRRRDGRYGLIEPELL
jgi:putative sigma-54 modulation protein